MKKANFIPILGQTQFHNYSNVVTNLTQDLVFAFSIKGKSASSFGKELSRKIEEWQIEDAQNFHHQILDLLKFCRDQKLNIEFSASFLNQEKVIFAVFNGSILLKRNGQVKKILESDNQISIIVGSHKDKDQIILFNKSSQNMAVLIHELLKNNISQSKLISQITIENSKANNNNAIAFLSYEEAKENKLKNKIDFEKIKEISKKIISQTISTAKNIFEFSKKTFFTIKNMDRQKLKLRAGIIALATILLLSFFLIRNRQKNKLIKETNQQITNIKAGLSNIEEKIENEPLIARQISNNVLLEFKTLEENSKNKDSKKLIQTEIEKLENLIEEISGENNLDKLSVAYDLSQISNQFLGKKISQYQGNLFVMGNESSEIIKINSKKNEINYLELEKINKLRDFTISNDRIYFLDEGISFSDLETIDEIKSLKDEGDSDRTGEFFNSFGDYLYLLNKEKRNIYRYYHRQDELSDPIGWLIDKQGISFDNINHFLVDGDVWLTFKDGKIMRFEKGESINFQVQGLEEGFNSPILIAGKEESNKIAVLEKKNKRLVILSRDGQLFSEIKSNELAAVNDICFSEDGENILAISGSVIYRIEI